MPDVPCTTRKSRILTVNILHMHTIYILYTLRLHVLSWFYVLEWVVRGSFNSRFFVVNTHVCIQTYVYIYTYSIPLCIHTVHVFKHMGYTTTGFGANSNQGQIVTNIGYYLGLLVTNLKKSPVILPIPN